MTTNKQLFDSLVKDQFEYGGIKYASNGEKESTDILFDDFSHAWLLGTMAKYIKRFFNLKRERDMLKIATYLYIMWLKRGFHLRKNGTRKIINTTIDIKKNNFNKFIYRTKHPELFNLDKTLKEMSLDDLYNSFVEIANQKFCKIKIQYIVAAYLSVYHIWEKEIQNKGQDKDTYNEMKLEKGI